MVKEINKQVYLDMLEKVGNLPVNKRGYYLGETFVQSLGYDTMDFDVVLRDADVAGEHFDYLIKNEYATILVFTATDNKEADKLKFEACLEVYNGKPTVYVEVAKEFVKVKSLKFGLDFTWREYSNFSDFRILFNPNIDNEVGDYIEGLKWSTPVKVLTDFLETRKLSKELLNLIGIEDAETFSKMFYKKIGEIKEETVSHVVETKEAFVEEKETFVAEKEAFAEKEDFKEKETDTDDVFGGSDDVFGDSPVNEGGTDDVFGEASEDDWGEVAPEVSERKEPVSIPNVNKLDKKFSDDPFADSDEDIFN